MERQLQEKNELDLGAFWMPFTANRQYKAAPRLLASAQGMYYQDIDGRQILDATAGLWTVNLGHGRAEIARAVSDQLLKLDFAPTFQMGHPIAFEFADRLKKIAPDGFGHVFFTNSGSESVETALKIALAYHHAKGEPQRTRLIGRERGYHGTNFGGISVGGIVNNRRVFGPLLPGVDHLPHTHGVAGNEFVAGQGEYGAYLANVLHDIAALHGPETIAAVIIEPVAGSTGVLVPPKGYLEALRAACNKIGCLLIFDEVITGYGRMGTPFASEYFGVMPDIFTTAKAITNGCLPMGAVFAHDKVHDAFMKGPENLIELFHGYTCSGHPVACAAGLASMDIFEREGLFHRVKYIEQAWITGLFSLAEHPYVKDIRQSGLIGAIELSAHPDGVGKRGYEAFTQCFQKGLLVRVTGDTIALSPPLVINEDEIGQTFNVIGQVLRNLG